MIICIDPGHSGPVEPGACAGGYTEADIVLAISLALSDMLQRAGHTVVMTRTGDIETDGLGFRADLSNGCAADLFCSIHCNAAENLAATGPETYHYPGSIAGAALADRVQAAIVSATGWADRGVKEADFAVLRLTDAPAVLIETGFISCDHDRVGLIDPAGQVNISHAIYSGLQEYIYNM